MSVDWTKVDTNPVSRRVQAELRRALLSRRGWIRDLDAYLESFTRGHSVLDIGSAAHNESSAERADWKFAKIARWASRAVGVDILATEVAELRARGFDIRVIDATSDDDLGERFDRVFLGDVIEHADDPVRMMLFAKRHLDQSGQILVKTPNPHFLAYVWRGLRDGTFIVNAEHTSWISPSMALEIGRRSGLVLAQYSLVQPRAASTLRQIAIAAGMIAFRHAELLNPSFLYLYKADV